MACVAITAKEGTAVAVKVYTRSPLELIVAHARSGRSTPPTPARSLAVPAAQRSRSESRKSLEGAYRYSVDEV